MTSEIPKPLNRPESVSFQEAFLYWLKLGFISFGGPAGQISMMHQELVERRRWISEQRFMHALNYGWGTVCAAIPFHPHRFDLDLSGV